MSGPLDSSQDLGLADQDRVLGEPVDEQLPESGNSPAPSPGSVPLFGEGKFWFPKALLEGGGAVF